MPGNKSIVYFLHRCVGDNARCKTNDFSYIKKSWKESGISSDFTNVMLHSLRPCTYITQENEWFNFCSRNSNNPFHSDMKTVLEF